MGLRELVRPKTMEVEISEPAHVTWVDPGVESQRVGEISTGWATGVGKGLRNAFRSVSRAFWPTTPTMAGTKITYAKTRSLYRNDDSQVNLGGGIIRRIINSRVDFMELPHPATGDEIVDEFLDNCIHVYWAAELQQMIRDACRDADTVVRIRRHPQDDPLVTEEEWEACYLEILPPERVTVYYKMGGGKKTIEAAYVRHEIEEIIEEAQDTGGSLRMPEVRQRVIIEEITPETYRYYDQTQGMWRDEMASANSWGFVPLIEVANEYEASLEGGQSDLEAPLPFIFALHDVMAQTLIAHKAHSIPKVKMKLNDLETFLSSNFPDSYEHDEMGMVKQGTFNGKVNWKGTEILFFNTEEDADFLEVESVLGDSKTLMDFLIDCIAIASETPRSILMATRLDDKDEITPFSKLINRKRNYFKDYVQEICKMVLSINLMRPVKVPLDWGDLTPDEAIKKAEALQANVMSMEVLATREVVSDRTIRASLRPFVSKMKSNSEEAADARGNKQLPVVSPQSISGSDSGTNE